MSFAIVERSKEELIAQGSAQWSRYPGTIPAWLAESDFGVAPEVKAAVKSAIDRELTGYLPAQEADMLQTVTAEWLRSELQWDVGPEYVALFGDAIQALSCFIEFFTAPRSSVVVLTPAYEPFHTLPVHLGRTVIQVPMTVDRSSDYPRFVLDLELIREALRDGAGSIILCNPQNPTGRAFTRPELLALAEVVSEFDGVRVFSDEVHAPITLTTNVHVPYASISPAAARQAVTVYSASKGWNLAGLKCAQLVFSNDADLELWNSLGPFPSHGVSTLGVIANIAAYTVGRSWIGDVNAQLARNRDTLIAAVAELLPGVELFRPEATYLAWLDFRALELPEEPAPFFLERARVSLYPGVTCGSVGAGHARFRFSMPEPILMEALERLASTVRS